MSIYEKNIYKQILIDIDPLKARIPHRFIESSDETCENVCMSAIARFSQCINEDSEQVELV